MINILSNFFGIGSYFSSVTKSDVGVNSVEADDNLSINDNSEGINSRQENSGTESGYNTGDEGSEVCEEEISECAEATEESEELEEFFSLVEAQEESEALNSSFEPESQDQKTISYALKPLLYTTKYGAKALSATTVVVSYALNGTSYVIAGASYVPHGASKLLEKCKGEDKNTAGYKVATASQNLLDLTSGAMYAVSYVPYGAAIALNGVSSVTGSVDSYLSDEKIKEICDKSDSFINNLSSKLNGVKTENFSQSPAIAS